jgi:hypothetical protein
MHPYPITPTLYVLPGIVEELLLFLLLRSGEEYERNKGRPEEFKE